MTKTEEQGVADADEEGGAVGFAGIVASTA